MVTVIGLLLLNHVTDATEIGYGAMSRNQPSSRNKQPQPANSYTRGFFKYKNGSDFVLVVKKDDYDKCNTEKLIMKMDDGDSVFKFDRSGPFFFISGNKDNCQKG
ncbi:early nodulin-like protein 2 [Cornus florida]|uniref:early nodulin-like protein 2 n=1 Tax=Cornus florida TaxID=4283 RepID=UPI00289AF48A|nr:early nodulin-like protein 2 [Cornus florida]